MNKDVVNAELLGVLSMFPRYCAEAPERLSMSRDEACIAVSSLIFTATTELGAKSGRELVDAAGALAERALEYRSDMRGDGEITDEDLLHSFKHLCDAFGVTSAGFDREAITAPMSPNHDGVTRWAMHECPKEGWNIVHGIGGTAGTFSGMYVKGRRNFYVLLQSLYYANIKTMVMIREGALSVEGPSRIKGTANTEGHK